MAKKLKVRIPDKKEDILVETTQSGLAWMRRYQGALIIGSAVVVAVVVLAVYGVELEKRGDAVAWEDYLALGDDLAPEAYAEMAARFPGTSVEPWALLDQAHALARSADRADWQMAADLYKDVANRFGEARPLIARIATEGQHSVIKEMNFRLPEAAKEPEEGEAADEPAPAGETPVGETPAGEPPVEDPPPDTPPPEEKP